MSSQTSSHERFDRIPYEDLSLESTWSELGKGSFGAVYLGEYLGLEVAIKEVMPSGDYDVDKYFQRECKLLAESRHPNIVQYLGLSLAPSSENNRRRILIISEYLPNGNLRSFIHHDDQPFPWRLRISFAIDICRAVAYLHARNCLHRDLKGENLLLTELNRVKVTDFGFARLAARNEEEMKRMSYCGTDGYMSPEILMGFEFGLSADIFSLGVIFCEIISRILVGGETFQREMPSFGINTSEIRSNASLHCPKAFIDLTIACVSIDPLLRPTIRDILTSLRSIEVEILEMESRGVGLTIKDRGGSWNVGTLSFSSGTTTKRGKKRPEAPRLPSFEGKVAVGSTIHQGGHKVYDSSQDSENDVTNIAMATVKVGRHGIGRGESEDGLTSSIVPEIGSEYSTEVIRRNERPKERVSVMDSTITVKALNTRQERNHNRLASTSSNSSLPSLPPSWFVKGEPTSDSSEPESPPIYSTTFKNEPLITISHVDSTLSYMTARTSSLSIAGATINHGSPDSSEDSSEDIFHSTLRRLPSDIEVDHFPPPTFTTTTTSSTIGTTTSASLHRFSLIKPVFQKFLGSLAPYSNTPSIIGFNARMLNNNNNNSRRPSDLNTTSKRGSMDEGSNGIFGGVSSTKCEICEKRLGMMKAYLVCDDCGFKCHIKCSDACSPTCGVDEETNLAVPLQPTRAPPPIPTNSITTSSTRASKLIKKRPLNSSTKISI